MSTPRVLVLLCGDRFRVTYCIVGDEAEAREKAEAVCLEQTVEFPASLVPAGDIREQIVGRLESLTPCGEGRYEATISYALETSGLELTQLLNVAFGNTSLKPGIRVERLELCDSLLRQFRGPRFGWAGLRQRLGVFQRPLLCTALKPMGLSCTALADLAYQFALGGIDIIKDDHGLADQSFSPFKERVQRCAAAVAEANVKTGLNCIYVPNLSGPGDLVRTNARYAKAHGVGGLMIAPGLTGFDSMRQLADDDELDLPIFSHPALLGSFVTHPHAGISHFALFGQLMRLAGADAVIFPNYGGRFAFSREDCLRIVDGTAVPLGHIKPSMPTPAGGMSLADVPTMLTEFGEHVIFLIGGALHLHGPDLVANSRRFRQSVTLAASAA
jgi:ribulose-bisphosphate carboxylase large chain